MITRAAVLGSGAWGTVFAKVLDPAAEDAAKLGPEVRGELIGLLAHLDPAKVQAAGLAAFVQA